jgi:hypothetical protein
MKKYFLLIALYFVCASAQAQQTIPLADAHKHIGDSVKVEGLIAGTRTLDDGRVLVNLGEAYPNQLLTLVVYSSYKTATIEMPSEKYKGDIAIVTGKLELYKGKPQIVVRTTEQLRIASGTPVVPKQ